MLVVTGVGGFAFVGGLFAVMFLMAVMVIVHRHVNIVKMARGLCHPEPPDQSQYKQRQTGGKQQSDHRIVGG